MPLRRTRAAAPQRGGAITPIHRGPQAAALPAAAPIPYHAPNAALLIDFDNVTMGIRSDLASELKSLLSSDIVRGKVSVQRAYADWRRYPQYIVPLSESSIDLIFAPAYGSSKKNATDIRLAIDALELVFTRPEIGTFILLSGDSDFSSLVIKLKEYGKYVIGVGIRESSSELLVQNCDEYYSYNALAGLVNSREEEVVKWDPWELASEAVQRMKRGGDVMRADRLKQVMQHIDSSFDEKNLGMAKFSRFVTEAAQRGILALHKMENGQYEVDLPKGKDGAAPASGDGVVAERPAEESVGAEERRGRSRRGRGRGREGREERPSPRPAVAAEPQAIVAESQLSLPVASGEVPVPALAETTVTPPRTPMVTPMVTPMATTGAVDTIGVGGLRLTRDEAFDLVRRAVETTGGNGTPTRASDVRRAARELLGRDSESLSERNFIRILQDAHDADVVDLRRRGDDYDVSPAVAAAPIADQLGVQTAVSAAAAKASAAAAAAALPRGMAPRGIMGRGARGRGPATKAKALPTDLLSVGVVDDTIAAVSAPSTVAVTPAAATPAAAEVEAAEEAGKGRARRGRKTATATKGASPSAARKSASKTARKRASS